ncbi:MAG: hypothetical protein HY744_25510 [Deltaproteobacteria bacterium]|nr:hypothetical protein [Deltaproteobacteria bacterium]
MIQPLGKGARLRPGDVALVYSWTTPGVVARLVRQDKGQWLAQYDWAGATKEGPVDHAEPVVSGVAPLGFVGFPKFGRVSLGLVVALTEHQGWLRTASGHVEIHERRKLVPLGLPRPEWRVGDSVQAFSWVGGFQAGKVTRVLEPGLRYAVELAEGKPEQSFFFAGLVEKL